MDFTLNVGELAEDRVQEMVENAFSSDFVFRSPHKQDGDEAADVLVLFDDVALVIQVKAQALGLDGQTPSEDLYWAKKNLSKAVRQVGGALRTIQDGRMPYIENDRRGRVAFDAGDYRWIYGLIVLHHRSESYNAAELVPSVNKLGIPVHVLSFRDFRNLCTLLDTPADLIHYLECRTEVLIPTCDPRVHEEEQSFQYYVQYYEDIRAAIAKHAGNSPEPADYERYANELRQIVTGTHPHLRYGEVIDHIISKLHDQDPELEPIQVGNAVLSPAHPSQYIKVATELGKIPRARRIALGHRYLEIAKHAADTGTDRHFATRSPGRSDCMVFLTSPLPREQRTERRKYLLSLTQLAKEYYLVRRAIGVATEPAGHMGSSYDVVFLESPAVATEGAQELGREIFGDDDSLLLDTP